MTDWSKPIRFAKVQNDLHTQYQPNVVGEFISANGQRLHIVMLRNWPSASGQFTFSVYNDDGEPLGSPEELRTMTTASGIFDPRIVNGPPITSHRGVVNGTEVEVIFDGDTPVTSKIVKT